MGEKTATDVLDPNRVVRDPSDIEPGTGKERKGYIHLERREPLHSRQTLSAVAKDVQAKATCEAPSGVAMKF